MLGLKGFLVLLKLMLLVMIITAAGYVSTTGEDCWNTLKKMESVSAQVVAAAKLPDVILNGDSPLPTRTVDGVETSVPPTTVKKKLARKNELKARGTLLMALPNEHQRNKPDLEDLSMDDLYNNLKIYKAEVIGSSSTSQNIQNIAFMSTNNTGSTNEAVKTAHGVSAANSMANASTLPNVDSLSDVMIYSFFASQSNKVQAQLEVNVAVSHIPLFLTEMDLKWQMDMLTMRARRFLNKTRRKINANGSETIGFNKSKVKCNNCHKKGAYKAGLESVEARLDVYKKNEVVFKEDMKILKLDIKLRDNALTELRKKFEKAKKERDDLKLTLEKLENSSKNLSKLLDSQVCDKFKTGVGFDSQVVDSQVFDSQENDRYKTSEGYHVVPPPYTRNFMPPRPNLVLADEEEYVFSELITSVPAVATSEVKTSESKPKSVSEPLIEDWISDSLDENKTEFKSKQRKPSFAKIEFVKSNEHVKTPRESVKKVENNKQAKYFRKNSQSPRGNKRNWNNLMTQKLGSNFEFKNKACYVCGSFNHLIKDCDFHKKKIVEKPVWNNASRVNHQNSHRLTHPRPKRNFVPRAVLMKSGLKTLNTARQNSLRAAVSVNTARPINSAYQKPTVNCARPASNVFNRAHLHVRRPFNKFTTNKNSNLKEKVNTVKGNVTTAGPKAAVSDNKGNEANAVKALACWVWRTKQK
ncbi:ribonuclease H-like domain-containing protein, partial [Tanacetum coccineum]